MTANGALHLTAAGHRGGNRRASWRPWLGRLPSSSAMHRFSFLLAVVALLLLGCARSASTRLSQPEVVQIASRAATDAGYKLADYKEPEAHFEFVRKDRSWTVFFVRKPPTPPGGHFSVWVDDQTSKTQVTPGE